MCAPDLRAMTSQKSGLILKYYKLCIAPSDCSLQLASLAPDEDTRVKTHLPLLLQLLDTSSAAAFSSMAFDTA